MSAVIDENAFLKISKYIEMMRSSPDTDILVGGTCKHDYPPLLLISSSSSFSTHLCLFMFISSESCSHCEANLFHRFLFLGPYRSYIFTSLIDDDSVGYFINPTIGVTRDPNFVTLREEIFGPVLTCYVYPDEKFEETVSFLCLSLSMLSLSLSLSFDDFYPLFSLRCICLCMINHLFGKGVRVMIAVYHVSCCSLSLCVVGPL